MQRKEKNKTEALFAVNKMIQETRRKSEPKQLPRGDQVPHQVTAPQKQESHNRTREGSVCMCVRGGASITQSVDLHRTDKDFPGMQIDSQDN